MSELTQLDEQESEVIELLDKVAKGDSRAADRLMPLVYERLRSLAGKMLRDERVGHSLQPTALVNEAYLRMAGQSRAHWDGKTHFFAIGAKMMRRILVDHARTKNRQKRGGGMHRISMDEDLCLSPHRDEDVLAIEELLEKLTASNQRHAQVVELRFFGGLSVAEVAEVLKVSKRTVESDWTFVRAWFRRELSESDDE